MARVTIYGNSTTVQPLVVPGVANDGTTFGVIRSDNCRSRLRLVDPIGGFGFAVNPFWFTWKCRRGEECEFESGDTVEMATLTIAIFEFTSVTWKLRLCQDSGIFFGISLGLGVATLKWRVE